MVYDNDFKNKLEQRSIQPSSNAWERLEVMLDAESEVSRKRGYFKYIAAACVLFLCTVLFFKNTESLTEDNNTVVTLPIDENVINKSSFKTVHQTPVAESESTKEKLGTKSKIKNRKELLEPVNSNQGHTAIKIANTYITATAKVNESKKIAANEVIMASKTLLHQNEKSFNFDKDASLTAEVNMLLAMAETSIMPLVKNSDTIKNNHADNFTVDANVLLADVEQELDMSFKAKVFKKLKEGFQKTKTAVVKRNN